MVFTPAATVFVRLVCRASLSGQNPNPPAQSSVEPNDSSAKASSAVISRVTAQAWSGYSRNCFSDFRRRRAQSLCGAAPKNITLLPAGSVWRYSADGTEPASTWRERTFDDSQWAAGQAEIGYGDGGEVTLVTLADPGTSYTYFRHTLESFAGACLHGMPPSHGAR
jgi:hypothetical protein